jgi:hypothetical protein
MLRRALRGPEGEGGLAPTPTHHGTARKEADRPTGEAARVTDYPFRELPLAVLTFGGGSRGGVWRSPSGVRILAPRTTGGWGERPPGNGRPPAREHGVFASGYEDRSWPQESGESCGPLGRGYRALRDRMSVRVPMPSAESEVGQ